MIGTGRQLVGTVESSRQIKADSPSDNECSEGEQRRSGFRLSSGHREGRRQSGAALLIGGGQ